MKQQNAIQQKNRKSNYNIVREKKAEKQVYIDAKDELVNKVRNAAAKAKRRYEPFKKRGLYLSAYENLAQSIERIEVSGWEGNIFGVSKDFTISHLEKQLAYYNRFLSATETKRFTSVRESVKEEGRTLADWAEEKEAINYVNKAGQEIGSPVVGELMAVVREDPGKYEEIKKALFTLKGKEDLGWEDKMKLVADKLSDELAGRILAYL